jgi:hypothetical protein
MADQINFTSTVATNQLTFDSSNDTFTNITFEGQVAVAPEGPAGAGVAAGGSTGQILKKTSGTDYATTWATLSSLDVGLGNLTNDAQLKIASNLSDIASAVTARDNLGAQGRVSISVGTTGDLGYITDGTADDVQLQAALDAANSAGGGIVQLVSDIQLSTMITLYPNVWLKGKGEDVTTITIPASFASGVVLRENSGTADYLNISDFTLDLSGKSGVGGIHIFQGDYVKVARIRLTGQGSSAPKWTLRVGNYDGSDPDGTASHGVVLEDVHIDNCSDNSFEQLLFVNQHDGRITRPHFSGNTNSLAYELMLYINNKNVVVESPHFTDPNAHSIGIMESSGVQINNITAKYDDNFRLVTIINSEQVRIDGIEAKNTAGSPTTGVIHFFDRLDGPDGFTQLVEDTRDVLIKNVAIDGWKYFVECQFAGEVSGTDYTMNQYNIRFENAVLRGMTSAPFLLGADEAENNLHDWDFDKVEVRDWTGVNVGAWQLRGYASGVTQMYNFRMRKSKVEPSGGGGANAAVRAISCQVQVVDDCDFTGTFTTYGALSTVTSGTILQSRAHHLATAAPGTGDDVVDGFSVGSRWYDTTNDKEYVCLDGTAGSAVWKETTSVPSDTAYGAGWNGSLDAPTKNAVYDKIETISAGSGITAELAIAYATAL